MRRYVPSLEVRVLEVIQDSMAGELREQGPLKRRGRAPHRIPKPSIIEAAVRRKLGRKGGDDV